MNKKKPCEEFQRAKRKFLSDRHRDRRPINKKIDPKQYDVTYLPQETEGST